MAVCTGRQRGRRRQDWEIFHLLLCNEKRNPIHGPGLFFLPKMMMQCSQAHHVALPAWWWLHSLGSCQGPKSATVAEFWSRTLSFVCLEACGVSWAHWVSAWPLQHGDLRNHTCPSACQENPHPGNSHCSHVPGGWAAHTKGNQVENMTSQKIMLKTLCWQHFTSLVQASSWVWCCPLHLIPAGGPCLSLAGWAHFSSEFAGPCRMDLAFFFCVSLRVAGLCGYY